MFSAQTGYTRNFRCATLFETTNVHPYAELVKLDTIEDGKISCVSNKKSNASAKKLTFLFTHKQFLYNSRRLVDCAIQSAHCNGDIVCRFVYLWQSLWLLRARRATCVF